MSGQKLFTFAATLAVCFAMHVSAAVADDAGQEDLDKATVLKAQAKSLPDLLRVAELCESAVKKGLDEEGVKFAEQLKNSSLFEHGSRIGEAIFQQNPLDPRVPLLRQMALQSLDRVLKDDDENAEAQLLVARLHSLPGGDRKRGQQAAEAAVKLAKDNDKALSLALFVRGTLAGDADTRVADFTQALKLDDKNLDARRARGLIYLATNKHAEAAEDFEKVVEADPKNVLSRASLAEALTHLKKFDEAIAQADAVIKEQPKESVGYTLKARIHVLQEDTKAAIKDLSEAIKVAPNDVNALVLRARLYQAEDDLKKARKDVDKALIVRPGNVQALLLRGLIAAGEDRWEDAIVDMRTLVDADPDNDAWKMQLAVYYVASERPRTAIKLIDEVVDRHPDNVQALRSRGDALLSIGKQKEAMNDYEAILKLDPDNDGALNNLAWTLATSPDENLRDGERAIELAKKACELTEFKAPHIISTLASAHAEAGDFKTAKKWSQKAVDMGEGEMKEQLEKELKSYDEGKPWRELQEVKEKPDVPKPSGGAFDL